MSMCMHVSVFIGMSKDLCNHVGCECAHVPTKVRGPSQVSFLSSELGETFPASPSFFKSNCRNDSCHFRSMILPLDYWHFGG